jgi:hypothetical protein
MAKYQDESRCLGKPALKGLKVGDVHFKEFGRFGRSLGYGEEGALRCIIQMVVFWRRGLLDSYAPFLSQQPTLHEKFK